MATVNTLPDELTNKIIMMTIPKYAFMEELKTARFIRWGCDCEGCTEKHYYGCYYYRDFNYRLKKHRLRKQKQGGLKSLINKIDVYNYYLKERHIYYI